jgi:SAM-dependent methyltransferase
MPDQADIASSKLLHAKAWSEVYELIDFQLSPLGLAAMDALGVGQGDVVLDVGCGTGQTLLQLAERVGTGGQVIGVDIAPLLLDVARQRASALDNVALIEADAQSLDLPTASADAVFSRFGVMGFSDPVAAFANFARMLKPGGKLAFVCWRSLEQNELDRFPLAAGGFESAADDTPFSFADPNHISRTLGAAGLSDIAIRPLDQMVSSGDVDAMSKVLSKVGPLGKILRENPALRATAEARLRKALAALGDPTSVELRASVWIVTARAATR